MSAPPPPHKVSQPRAIKLVTTERLGRIKVFWGLHRARILEDAGTTKKWSNLNRAMSPGALTTSQISVRLLEDFTFWKAEIIWNWQRLVYAFLKTNTAHERFWQSCSILWKKQNQRISIFEGSSTFDFGLKSYTEIMNMQNQPASIPSYRDFGEHNRVVNNSHFICKWQ